MENGNKFAINGSSFIYTKNTSFFSYYKLEKIFVFKNIDKGEIMKKLIFIFILIYLFSLQSVYAIDGNDFIRQSKESNQINAAWNNGYIDGFIKGKRSMSYFIKFLLEDGGLALEKHHKYSYGIYLWRIDELGYVCVKEGVRMGQIVDIVKLYIQNNPAERHKHFDKLIEASLEKSKLYSCKSSDYSDDKIRKYIRTK